ncbi:protein of unknown function [Nitrospira japonica]|uniref:Uncharacterized protein n=1 Tax=Nitrospira japonica TaxID=1325564 RepID=A0A1W1I490_9BACT|nr:protein of unknown function [Nitrospira japonica]
MSRPVGGVEQPAYQGSANRILRPNPLIGWTFFRGFQNKDINEPIRLAILISIGSGTAIIKRDTSPLLLHWQ